MRNDESYARRIHSPNPPIVQSLMLSPQTHTARLDAVRARLREREADAVLLTFLPDVRWACGFTGSNGMLLVTEHGAQFITDGRYTAQAKDEVHGARVHIGRGGLYQYIDEEGLLEETGEVLFQGDHVPVQTLHAWEKRFEGVSWTSVSGFLRDLVAEKSDDEVNALREAQSITEAVFDELLDVIEPGMTEREVAAEIVYRHLRRGAEKMSFDPIVASGPNGAKPHARPTDRVLKEGELVVIDMGGFRNGYVSDMTRTVALGEPGAAAREGYALVLRAQRAALQAARAGMASKDLDAVARDVIADGGLGDHFAHGLGHGVGLQIHEWPRVSYTADYELPAGAAVTIEPGVYVPDDGYGVRIEDVVILREDGCENLTAAEKELVVLE